MSQSFLHEKLWEYYGFKIDIRFTIKIYILTSAEFLVAILFKSIF
jgi:hypothetical protein